MMNHLRIFTYSKLLLAMAILSILSDNLITQAFSLNSPIQKIQSRPTKSQHSFQVRKSRIATLGHSRRRQHGCTNLYSQIVEQDEEKEIFSSANSDTTMTTTTLHNNNVKNTTESNWWKDTIREKIGFVDESRMAIPEYASGEITRTFRCVFCCSI